MKEYKLKINGNDYAVTVKDVDDAVAEVEVNGTPFKVEFEKPITKKPADTRMGSGKGAQVGHVAVVKRDRVIIEVSGPSEAICLEALRLASHKLPCKTRVVYKEKGGENNEE